MYACTYIHVHVLQLYSSKKLHVECIKQVSFGGEGGILQNLPPPLEVRLSIGTTQQPLYVIIKSFKFKFCTPLTKFKRTIAKYI